MEVNFKRFTIQLTLKQTRDEGRTMLVKYLDYQMNLFWANFAENSIKAGMKEIKTISLLPQAFFEEPFEFRPTIEVNFFGRYSFTTKKLFNYYNFLVSATSNIVFYLEATEL